jgi:hypothetical protein
MRDMLEALSSGDVVKGVRADRGRDRRQRCVDDVEEIPA